MSGPRWALAGCILLAGGWLWAGEPKISVKKTKGLVRSTQPVTTRQFEYANRAPEVIDLTLYYQGQPYPAVLIVPHTGLPDSICVALTGDTVYAHIYQRHHQRAYSGAAATQ